MKKNMEISKAEAIVVKEESTQYLTCMLELKESNEKLTNDLKDSMAQTQELRTRVTELGNKNYY